MLRRWSSLSSFYQFAIDSAERALSLARMGEAPDLLLLDYQLGEDITGLDLLPRLSECWGVQPPAIVLSAQKDAQTRARVQEAGLRFLSKPVAPAALRALMSQVLLARAP